MYKTKQLEMIYNYMQKAEGHVTVKDVERYFEQNNSKLGLATIYRNLQKLVEKGVVAKYVIAGTNSACFEFLGECQHEACIHLKCESCGEIFHLNCKSILEVKEHINDSHGFNLNLRSTIFYGLCDKCKNKYKEKSV
ncbi:MAG: transcriptional repressor [Ezakiella sp.]|nr:transcriptional repressor [Ezakiella sp.]MDD7761339.1 transcriptional repressor [Bacillota bacterium]MDY3947114.1 transcriptional repressor [Ezakiella sp.]